MATLLIVDDEPAIQHAFRRAFQGGDVILRSASTAAEAIEQISREQPDVVVLDVRLPDATGLETFRRIRGVDARIPVILVTGHGTTDLAIEAMKEGAFDYLLKPLELPQLRQLIDRAIRSSQLMRTPASMPEVEPSRALGDALIGRCPAMQDVYKAIGQVASQDVTVLILGESGTGKELVARSIYQHSRRVAKPYLAINAGAIPGTLLESELFGHEKGAFTGAERKRIGKFEQCSGGTIFLDEVAEMPMAAQISMLRLIQEQQFQRVGGNETVHSDVRLIAATNANLEEMVEQGRFRKDLFFRLHVFSITLPPLRDRGEDIALLIDHCTRRISRELNKPIEEIAPESMELLRAYPWPGNVRELQSVLKQSLLQVRGAVLLPEFLPGYVTSRSKPLSTIPEVDRTNGTIDWDGFAASRISEGTENLYAESLERMEREVILRVLRHTEGNQVQAARILGITRGSLRNKIRTLGISIERSVWSDDGQDGS